MGASDLVQEMAQTTVGTGDDFFEEDDFETHQIHAMFNQYGNKPIKPRDSTQMRCFTCKRLGHVKAQCRQKIAPKTSEEAKKKRGACFICRDEGHWADKCPQKKSGFWGKTGSNPPP